MAEAAHVYPPSGAQGMNTSLADAAMLGDLLAARGLAYVPRLLRQYQASRLPDHLARYAATGGLSAMTRLSDPLGQAVRRVSTLWRNLLAPRPAPLARRFVKVVLGSAEASGSLYHIHQKQALGSSTLWRIPIDSSEAECSGAAR